MKIWPLLVGMIIVALICSPVLAISKGDLIFQYREGWSGSIWAEQNPFYLEKNTTEFQRPKIIDYGPAPSSHLTVAEFLNWGSIGGVPESWYAMRINISHHTNVYRLIKTPGGIL